ncbi:hypothetical protein V6N13_096393 [Hibiscus sabdariffa]
MGWLVDGRGRHLHVKLHWYCLISDHRRGSNIVEIKQGSISDIAQKMFTRPHRSPVPGTVSATIGSSGVGYMNQRTSARADGPSLVSAILWPQLAAALESDSL